MESQQRENVPAEEDEGVPPGMVGVLMAASCMACIMICLFIAYFVWAVMTIFDSSGASTTPCAGDSNIWIFCLVAVIVMPIAGCVVNMLSSMADSAGVVIQMIPSVVNLVISVWGMLLWANMTNECMSFYGNDFSNLLLLFKINVVLLAVSAVVLVIVVCVGVATLTAAISQGGKTNRYENIPDHPGGAAPSGLSSVSSTLTEEYV